MPEERRKIFKHTRSIMKLSTILFLVAANSAAAYQLKNGALIDLLRNEAAGGLVNGLEHHGNVVVSDRSMTTVPSNLKVSKLGSRVRS